MACQTAGQEAPLPPYAISNDHLDGVPVPRELQNVSLDTLRNFVEACMQNRSQSRVHRPSASGDRRRKGMKTTDQEPLGPQLSTGSRHRLGFGHECHMLVACARPTCGMCASAQLRECDSAGPKRLYEDEVLSTPCDSPNLWVHLSLGGSELHASVATLGVEFALVDGQEYDARQPFEQCLRLDYMGKALLASKTVAQSSNQLVRVPFKWNKSVGKYTARLPDLYVTMNTTAVRKKSGLSPVRDPSFRLFARPVNLETGAVVAEISPAVTKPFRVVGDKAGEGKADKPLLDDPVHLLAGIGPETVTKLRDLGHAARAKNVMLPFERIETVRQLRELVRWTREGGPGNTGRDAQVRSAINMRRGAWNEVQVLAEQAIENDVNVRIWYSDSSMTAGLLFCACRGTTRVAEPVGVLHREVEEIEGKQHHVMVIERLVPMVAMPEVQQMRLKNALDAARTSWECTDHGTWITWQGVASVPFHRDWCVPDGVSYWAPVPPCAMADAPQAAEMRPFERKRLDLPFETDDFGSGVAEPYQAPRVINPAPPPPALPSTPFHRPSSAVGPPAIHSQSLMVASAPLPVRPEPIRIADALARDGGHSLPAGLAMWNAMQGALQGAPMQGPPLLGHKPGPLPLAPRLSHIHHPSPHPQSALNPIISSLAALAGFNQPQPPDPHAWDNRMDPVGMYAQQFAPPPPPPQPQAPLSVDIMTTLAHLLHVLTPPPVNGNYPTKTE